ncbi:Oidioi.mRNA.OKI2018_I69.chr2.g7605.t1.cds [Oikopleura dioica]|uniref:Oidioi.mRNA.OKI2018_I69.chr2.g7605.t1.cds n=1 Tax=Oikopleura dioica TaxID=34765 RepID=A0ABN7TFJ7_OIKDI|nr:Oidioi.mRNA.OKI2018_I69.chr2.g7605.t1.cds [Oikopleura dioica]
MSCDVREFGLFHFSVAAERYEDLLTINQGYKFTIPSDNPVDIYSVVDEVAAALAKKCLDEECVGDTVLVVVENDAGITFKREECLSKKSREKEIIGDAIKELIRMEFMWKRQKISILKVSLKYKKAMEIKEENKHFGSTFFTHECYQENRDLAIIDEKERRGKVNWVKAKTDNSPLKTKGRKSKKEMIKTKSITALFAENMTNVPGTSKMNLFLPEENSNSRDSFVSSTPSTPVPTTKFPKAAPLVQEYRDIDENSMDAYLESIISDPKERELMKKFSGLKTKPIVNHVKKEPPKTAAKSKRGRPKKTPPKITGSVQSSAIFQMFKKSEDKKKSK